MISDEEFKKIRMHEFIPEILEEIKGKKVLDIGASGDGGRIHRLLRTRAKELDGIDLVPMEDEGIIKMDIEKKHPKKKYDVIIFSGVLDHLHNPGLAMQNISKCSHPGTLMYICIPNIFQIGYLVKVFLGRSINDDPSRMYYTEDNITYFLNWYNWKVIDIRYNKDQGPDRNKLIRKLIRPLLRENLGVTMLIRAKYLGKPSSKGSSKKELMWKANFQSETSS